MKRKHQFMVEMTFNKGLRVKEAMPFIERLCDGDDHDQVHYEESVRSGAEWTHYCVKDGNRVLAAAKRPKERIVAAAIFHGACISLPPPARHHTILNFMATTMGLDATLVHPVNQGFLTSKGRFVNRTEGFYIADRMGQIVEKTGNKGEPTLYSEDLW